MPTASGKLDPPVFDGVDAPGGLDSSIPWAPSSNRRRLQKDYNECFQVAREQVVTARSPTVQAAQGVRWVMDNGTGIGSQRVDTAECRDLDHRSSRKRRSSSVGHESSAA